jgi:dCTP deaminase
MTEEIIRVPKEAMAFISMRATFRMKGPVNVSGFHADPGWEGPLIFASLMLAHHRFIYIKDCRCF